MDKFGDNKNRFESFFYLCDLCALCGYLFYGWKLSGISGISAARAGLYPETIGRAIYAPKTSCFP